MPSLPAAAQAVSGGSRLVDGVSGHSEPSVVNHSDHSAGSEMPLRGCGRAHRSPSSAFAKTTLLGQTLLPQTRLFSWLDSARLDSSSCHRVRTRVHGPSVLSGPLACGDRFATCVTSRSRRNFRRPPRSPPPPPAGSFPGPGARCRSRRSPCPRLDSRTVGVDVRTHTVLGHRPAPARVGPRW